MFKPWVGKNYGVNGSHFGGQKILVVGESHYTGYEDQVGKSADVTTEIVEELALRTNQRFFTGITQVISGQRKTSMSKDDLRGLWESVIFYNYVPVFVGTKPRVRPTTEMWKLGHEPFMGVLAEYKPQIVLVCGFGLWGWMFQSLYPDLERPWESPSPHEFEGTVFVQMMHPSAIGFSWLEWHNRFKEALASS